MGDAALDADNAAEYDAAWGKKQRQIDLDANAQAARFAAAKRDARDNGYDQVWGISADRQEAIARNGPTWSFMAASAQATQAEREARAAEQRARNLDRTDIPSLVPSTGQLRSLQDVWRDQAIQDSTHHRQAKSLKEGLELTAAYGMGSGGRLALSAASVLGGTTAYVSAKVQGQSDKTALISAGVGFVSPYLSGKFAAIYGKGIVGDVVANSMVQSGGNALIQTVQIVNGEREQYCYRDIAIAGGLGAAGSLFTYPMTVNNPKANTWNTELAKTFLTPGVYVDNAQAYVFSEIDKINGGCK